VIEENEMKKTKAEMVEATLPSTKGQNNWKVSVWRNGMTGKIQVVAQEGRTKVRTYSDGKKARSWECELGLGTDCGDRRYCLVLDAPRLTEKVAKEGVGKMLKALIDNGLATDGEINIIEEN
jgi:hypothetical protein